jgi:hypothetical protein
MKPVVEFVQAEVCLIRFVFQIAQNEEMLNRHCFSTSPEDTHSEGPRKRGGIETEWDKSASGLR